MAPYLQTIKNRSIFLQVRDHGELTRGKALDSIQGIVSVDTKIGTVEINHTN